MKEKIKIGIIGLGQRGDIMLENPIIPMMKDGAGIEIIAVCDRLPDRVSAAAEKLEKAGYVTTYSAEYQGRKRKYYSITEAGKTQMAYLQGEWKSYRDTIDNIIEWRKKE